MKKIIFPITAFLILCSGGFFQYANAGPVVQSASGTYSGDANSNAANTISITGSGFGNKVVSWQAWATFENGIQPIASLSVFPLWTTQIGAGSGEAVVVTTSPWAGAKCLGNTVPWQTHENTHYGVGIATQLARGGKFMWRYAGNQVWNAPSNMNQKRHRMWGKIGDAVVLNNAHTSFDSSGGYMQVENGGNDYGMNHKYTVGYGTWSAESLKVQINSANQVTDGVYKIRQGTNSYANYTWASDASGSYNGTFRDIHLQDVWANSTPGAGAGTYLDDVLFMSGDDAWAEAFITNTPDLTTATIISPIIISTGAPVGGWSPTHLVGYFHQGALVAGKAAWIQVCDTNDSCTTSTSALQITIGGSGASTTQLNSSFTAVNVTSATVSLQSFASPSVNFVLSQVADFSTTVSSTLVTSDNKVFTGLNQNTQYYFQSKLSTETTYNSSITTITLVGQSGAAIYSSPIGKSGGGSQGTR